MKASELRDLLQDAIDKYGDLEVFTFEPYTCERNEQPTIEPWSHDTDKNVYRIDRYNPEFLYVG